MTKTSRKLNSKSVEPKNLIFTKYIDNFKKYEIYKKV